MSSRERQPRLHANRRAEREVRRPPCVPSLGFPPTSVTTDATPVAIASSNVIERPLADGRQREHVRDAK